MDVKSNAPGYRPMIEMAKKAGAAVEKQVTSTVEQEPSLVFRTAAVTMKDQLVLGAPDMIAPVIDRQFHPVLRACSLAIDGKKAIDTMKDGSASGPDKLMEVSHVAFDCMGLAGAALMACGTGPLGPALLATGVMADITTLGYHLVRRMLKTTVEGQAAPAGATELSR